MMEPLLTHSWWIDPAVQWSYAAFRDALERELPRMTEQAGKFAWPIDAMRGAGKPASLRVLIRH